MAVELFAGIPVRDYEQALVWYQRLLGSAPSFLPNATEAVWELAEHRWLFIEVRPEHAGHSMHTVFVDDLDAVLSEVAGRGIEPAELETYSNGVRKATYRDPDGNEIGFGGAPVDQPSGPVVTALRIAPGRRLAMKAVDEAVVETGRGIIGDRYHGTKHRHVTVQSAERLAEAEAELGIPVLPEGTRRNVTISHGDVPTAPGSRITIGEVELEVIRVAAPCRILDDEIAQGAAVALRRRAGSVCRALVGGVIRVGAPVEIDDAALRSGAT